MPELTGHGNPPDEMSASADHAAAAALQELPEALILVFDKELRFVLTAGHALERLGNPQACSEGEPVANTFPAALWKRMEPLFRSALDGETRSREIWTPEQRHCLMVDVGPLHLNGPPNGSTNGEHTASVAGGVAVVLDITARRHADMLSANSHGGDFEEVFERAPIGTALLDNDGRWLLVNRALCDITGYTAEELVGKRFDGIVHPDDAHNDVEQRRRLLAGEIPAFQVEKRYFDAAGETVSAILSVSLVRDRDGAPLHYIAQLQDISERKRLEEHLRHLADHDPLTGLRNRRLFEHDLKLQVARSQRYGEVAGLMVIDLDEFKTINDTHGHKAGDDALKAVARALTPQAPGNGPARAPRRRRVRGAAAPHRRGGRGGRRRRARPRAAGMQHRCRRQCAASACQHRLRARARRHRRAPSRCCVEADRAMYAAKHAKAAALALSRASRNPPAR